MKPKSQKLRQLEQGKPATMVPRTHRMSNNEPHAGGFSKSENRPKLQVAPKGRSNPQLSEGETHQGAQLRRNPESAKSVLALAARVLQRNQPRNFDATKKLHTPLKSTPKSCMVFQGCNSENQVATHQYQHPAVTCAACAHWQPDPINPQQGLGRCLILDRDPHPLPWPHAPRRCSKYLNRENRRPPMEIFSDDLLDLDEDMLEDLLADPDADADDRDQAAELLENL